MVDNFKYTGIEMDGNLTWETEELSPLTAEKIWTAISCLALLAEEMTDRMLAPDYNKNWKHLEDESIDNHMYFVIKSELTGNRTNDTYPGYDNAQIYHTFWIDQSNLLLYKVELNQILESTGWYSPGYDRVLLVSKDIFTFYDYNIPVNIELPPELKR